MQLMKVYNIQYLYDGKILHSHMSLLIKKKKYGEVYCVLGYDLK